MKIDNERIEVTRFSRPSLRQLKLGLIPLLGIMLIGIIWKQDSGDLPDSAASDFNDRDSAPRLALADGKESRSDPARSWPVIPLERIAAHSPFDKPAAFQPAKTNPETALAMNTSATVRQVHSPGLQQQEKSN